MSYPNQQELQAHVDGIKAAANAAIPCLFHEIDASDTWKRPAFFTCTSGVLLWGQLHSLMEGSVGEELDTPLGPYCKNEPGDDGNTILQHGFRYRAPARKGVWKVEGAYVGSTKPIGFVCHHLDVDGADLLRRAALVGASLINDHQDREIVYVNRYDWARWGCGRGEILMTEVLKPEKKPKAPSVPKVAKPPKVIDSAQNPDPEEEDEEYSEEEEDEEESDDGSFNMNLDDYDSDFDDEERGSYEENLVANRFMLVDAQGFPQLVQALREGVKLDRKNCVLRCQRGSDSSSTSLQEEALADSFGVNLGINWFDYELGWLAFEKGELVGVVYDGAYCDLYGSFFKYGDTVVEVPCEESPDYNSSGDLWDSANGTEVNPFH